jgi:molecular chaperone DnaK
MASGNRELARFNLVDIPPAPRGVPKIEVKFDIDVNGIVSVSAKDVGTGKEQKITVEAPTRLSDEEIDKMVKDAETHAEEDKKLKEKVEARNALDSMVFGLEKTIKDNPDKVEEAVKTEIEASIKEAKEKLDTAELEELVSLREGLEKHSHKIAEALYKNAEAEGQAGGAQPGAESTQAKEDPEIVDAEFEEK